MQHATQCNGKVEQGLTPDGPDDSKVTARVKRQRNDKA